MTTSGAFGEHRARRMRSGALAIVLGLTLALTACGSDDPGQSTEPEPPRAEPADDHADHEPGDEHENIAPDIPDGAVLAPDFALDTVDGRTVRLSDYLGRPVAIVFMHTY